MAFLLALAAGCQQKAAEAPDGSPAVPPEVLTKAKVTKESPVYNVKVDPYKLDDPLVLLPGKETSVIFYIGPQSEESVTRGLEPVPFITGYEGDKLELTVTLSCSLCENKTYQQDQIAYRPKDRKSSWATFKIVPSAATVSKSQGLGNLMFTVEYRGNIVDRIRVQAFVGDPTAQGLQAYAPPVKVPIETFPLEEAKDPDIKIVVGYADASGKIPIIIRPRLEGLQKAFLDQFGAGLGSEPEMSWEFKSGVSKAEIDGLVLDIYKVFRTVNEQNNEQLQKDYRSLGTDATLERGAAMLDFSDNDRKKMLDILRKEGENLYWRIFSQGEVDLAKAMQLIDNVPSDRALRVTIQSADIYAPWQILYPFKKDSDIKEKTEPTKFWGFRYMLSTTYEEDSRQGRPHGVISSPKPGEIAFAGWWSDPKDEVTERVGMLAGYIKGKAGVTVAPSYERKKFISGLESKASDIRFVFAYGHATSGMVLDKDKSIITGVEWAAAHFKFSKDELLTPRHFDDLARKVHLKAQPIVILDACETGTFGVNAMNNNGFVGALTRLGAGAVIVTESPVLANFAYHFGMSLIDELFVRKVDVSEAMLDARLKHLREWKNPLGLVYTLYGNPTARIKGQ